MMSDRFERDLRELENEVAALTAERDALREAAIALRDDMIERAEMNKRFNGGDVVIEAGNGVWFRFNEALKGVPNGQPRTD
jgi:hypothetical protein